MAVRASCLVVARLQTDSPKVSIDAACLFSRDHAERHGYQALFEYAADTGQQAERHIQQQVAQHLRREVSPVELRQLGPLEALLPDGLRDA